MPNYHASDMIENLKPIPEKKGPYTKDYIQIISAKPKGIYDMFVNK